MTFSKPFKNKADKKVYIYICEMIFGEKVVISFSEKESDWRLIENNGLITFAGSIGNKNFACKSHYSIIENKIFDNGKFE